MLFSQILNLEFFLVNLTFVLEAGLFLPIRLEKVAYKWIRTILELHAIIDSQERLVLSKMQNDLRLVTFFTHSKTH